ncbi:MAG: 23S rRNA (uracil(1939)-C(5))-methyltransferase RlmD [Dictyoglomaceae bacterium]
MVKIGEEYIVKIDHVNHQGQGIAHINTFVVFVENALLDEVLKIRITKVKKDYAIAKITEIIEKNPNRVNPPCKVYYQCGGCHLMHMDYSFQLEVKRRVVEDALKRIGKMEFKVNNVLGMNYPFRYRNKAKIPVGKRNNKVVLGFYKPGTHEIVNIERCIVHHEDVDRVIEVTKDAIKRFNISIYNEEKHKGLLRFVVVRRSFAFDEIMIILVVKSIPDNINKIASFYKNEFKNLTSFYVNINPCKTTAVLGEKSLLILGKEIIRDKIGEFVFNISPVSFFQVNSIQVNKLYSKVLEFLNLNSKVVFDAYCGIGTISLFLSKKAKKVYGIELSKEAVDDAFKNAKRNKVDNVEFICDKSESAIPKLIDEGIIPDTIVLDPPRGGCDRSLLEKIIKSKINQVIYVSCYPSTLARDISILKEGGYKLLEIQPVDMFPQTFHVECIANLMLE